MLKTSCLFFLLLAYNTSYAKDGYKIEITLNSTKFEKLYLAHYYGAPLPAIYKSDSAIIKNGKAVLNNDKKLLGGIYLILLDDKKTYFEFLLDNGDEVSIQGDPLKFPLVTFNKSSINDDFLTYILYLKNEDKSKWPIFRENYVKSHPTNLLSTIFSAMEIPTIPEEVKKQGESYMYYKSHYWDKFNFHDDRLINTPLLGNKVEEYLMKLVVPLPDSLILESNFLLHQSDRNSEIFKFTLWKLTNIAEKSNTKEMGKLFSYLVKNYYNKGYAKWISSDQLKKYNDKVHEKENITNSLLNEFIEYSGLEGIVDAETIKAAAKKGLSLASELAFSGSGSSNGASENSKKEIIIPPTKRVSEWYKKSGVLLGSYQQQTIEFTDGEQVSLYIGESKGVYFLQNSLGTFTHYLYDMQYEDAIKAAYIYVKYGKLITKEDLE